MLIEILIGLAAAIISGVIAELVRITIAAIIDCILGWWFDVGYVVVVAPEASAELQRIANSRIGNKQHKRFVYNTQTRQVGLVGSNQIADELRYEDMVTVSVH